MFRPCVVALLLVALFLQGCASRRPAADADPSSASLAETIRKYTWHDEWIDNYPKLKGVVEITLVTLLVIAAVCLLVLASTHGD